MNKKNKAPIRFFTMLFASIAMMSAVFSSGMPVYAEVSKQDGMFTLNQGKADFGRGSASITIWPNDKSQPLIGKTFYVYQLFHVENSANLESVKYSWNPQYQEAVQYVVGNLLGKKASDVTEYEVFDYIRSLNNFEGENGRYSDFRYFIETLRDELLELEEPGEDKIFVTSVREDGSILLDGLEYGYYVIDEVGENANSHSASSLCIVDTANPFTEVQVKSDYPQIIKKIQEDDKKDEIGNDGWNDMGDYEIGQNVPYRFTSNIPNLNGYHTYYYAWHDKMDEALTFHADSVQIVISSQDETEYKLSSDEFRIKENVVNKEGNLETFVVEIDDIKQIVDTHFDKKDAYGHNTYGQNVVLTYHATLNEKAALDTGIPGFENDVRLEFSNDPDNSANPEYDGSDKTGYTPWDTVVCFTYRLDGYKVNNKDQALENAKFRLYADEECTDEVYLKTNSNKEYIVIHDDSTEQSFFEAVEISTHEDGAFSVIGLDAGTYYLKETSAPAGYRMLIDPIVITIEPTFVENRNEYLKGDGAVQKALLELDFTAHVNEVLDGFLNESDTKLEVDFALGAGNLTVVNTVGTKLPLTGSGITVFLFVLGSGMMLAACLKMKQKTVAIKQ